jgi:hypothetical protein
MNKKILYIGAIMFILGIAVLIWAPSAILNFTNNNQTVTLHPNSVSSLPIILSNSGIFLLTYSSANSTNLILANSSAYSQLSSKNINSSMLMQNAQGLESKGVLEIVENTTYATYPYEGGTFGKMIYVNPNSSITQAGKYYAILQNPNSNSIQAGYSMQLSNNITNNMAPLIAFGLSTMILLVGGVIVLIYGILKKKPADQNDIKDEKEEVDKLYASLDRHARKPLIKKSASKKGNDKKQKTESRNDF